MPCIAWIWRWSNFSLGSNAGYRAEAGISASRTDLKVAFWRGTDLASRALAPSLGDRRSAGTGGARWRPRQPALVCALLSVGLLKVHGRQLQ